MSSHAGYRPEIDGLRCVAVLPVVIFHLQKDWLPGGYLGVDVFFVISGFLITSILLRQWELGQLSLLGFWNRRIRRILPAALGVLFFFSLFQNAFYFRPDLKEFLGNKFAALFSYANIHSWLDVGDYWGANAEQSPFLHFWSLSVEEQYYLFYPLLILAILTWFRKMLVPALLVISVISWLLYLYGSVKHPQATFYLLPTRVWELGAGCLLASLPQKGTQPHRTGATSTGLLLILTMYIFSGASWLGGLEEMGAVIGACLVIHGSSNALSKMALENPFAVWTGRLSYSIYLWHWPVIVSLILAADYQLLTINAQTILLSSVVIAILSVASFSLIETPLRRHKHGTPVALVGLVLLAGFFLVEPRWMHSRLYADESRFDRPLYHGYSYNLKPTKYLRPDSRWNDGSVLSLEREASDTAFKEGGIIRPGNTETPRVVVLGDSYAGMWCKLVDELCQEKGLTVSLWSMDGESSFMDIPLKKKTAGNALNAEDYYSYNESRLKYLELWKPDLVILAGIWEWMNHEITKDLLDFLEEHAGHVMLIESVPTLTHVGKRNFLEFFSFLNKEPETDGSILWPSYFKDRLEHVRSSLSEYIHSRSDFYYLPVADLFLRDDKVLTGQERKIYYLDDNHITYSGSNLARDRFSAAIDSVMNQEAYPFDPPEPQ